MKAVSPALPTQRLLLVALAITVYSVVYFFKGLNWQYIIFIPTKRISVRFLSWEFWDFCRRHNHFRRFPKKSEVFRRRRKSAEGEVIEKMLIHKIGDREEGIVIYSFTHGFRSLQGSEWTYFWKLFQARRQQLTFFNQAWEIGPQAWASVRSKFSTRRRESWQVYILCQSCLGQSPAHTKE